MPAPAPSKSKLLAPHQVIVRPLVTEKGMHRSTRNNAYSFEVNPQANKHDIRAAIEELFNVKVVRVHTMNRRGKPRRTRMKAGQTRDWKKAIVVLHAEHQIALF